MSTTLSRENLNENEKANSIGLILLLSCQAGYQYIMRYNQHNVQILHIWCTNMTLKFDNVHELCRYCVKEEN